MVFIVIQANGREMSFATVQDAFTLGNAKVQKVNLSGRVEFPAAYVKDEEGRTYGPILRP